MSRLDNGISANSFAPFEGYLKLEERPKKEPSIYQAHSHLPSLPSCTILQKCWKILWIAQYENTLRLNEINFRQNDRIHKEDWTHFAFNSEQSLKCCNEMEIWKIGGSWKPQANLITKIENNLLVIVCQTSAYHEKVAPLGRS